MKVLEATCCLLVISLVLAEDIKYTTKYDSVDIDSVIQNERLLASYVGCLLERKPCTSDAAELKTNLPDALATNCSSCSEAQKRIADKLSHHLIDHRPDDWSLLEEKYDPTGAYRECYLHSRELAAEEEENLANISSSAKED